MSPNSPQINLYWVPTRPSPNPRIFQHMWAHVIDLRAPGGVAELMHRLRGGAHTLWLQRPHVKRQLKLYSTYTN